MSNPEPGSEVSVIIPARDAESYLVEAISSVLQGRVTPAEILVVDDGSVDETANVARSFGERVRLLQQESGGPGAARNLGVSESNGSLIAFLDADDLWTPDSLAHRLAALSHDGEPEAVFGAVEQFICESLSATERAQLSVPVRRLPGWTAGSMLARRSLLRRVGAFPTQYRAGEFIAWWLRARQSGTRWLMLEHLVLRRRLHATNLGRTDRDGRADLLSILRADLATRSG